MDTLTPLERAVLEKLVSGDSDRYRILQKQIPALRVSERKMTGVGFFTGFSIPNDISKLSDEATFQIGGIGADINDLEHGAGFVLFSRMGKSKRWRAIPMTSPGLATLIAFICISFRPQKGPEVKRNKSHAYSSGPCAVAAERRRRALAPVRCRQTPRLMCDARQEL